MITSLVVALWAAIISGFFVSVVLIPVARLVTMASTDFSRLLFKFLLSVVSLQILNAIQPFILLASYYHWISSPDLVVWLYVVAIAFLVIENLIVGWFAFWMYRRLKSD